MATEQENIKIVVEVVDKFSKPLVDLKKQLEGISDQGKGPKSLSTNFDTLRESMVGVAKTVTSFVMPSLRVLGLGFAGLSATIAGAVLSLKGFASSIADLSRLSRETGLTIEKMRELEAAGRRVGLSANEMRAGFRAFSDEVDKMRVGVSAAANEMRQRGLGFVVEGLKARTGDLNKQLDYALSIMDRISNPRHRREFARMIGLPENFATLTGKEREAAIAEFKKTAGAVTKEAEEASKRFEANMQRLADSMEGLVNKLAEGGALDTLATSLKSIADSLELIVKWAGIAKKAADENQKPAQGPVVARPKSPGRPLTIWEQLFGLNNPYFNPFGYKSGSGEFTPGAPGGGRDPKDILKQSTTEGVVEGLIKFASLYSGRGGDSPYGPGGTRVLPASLGPSGGNRVQRSVAPRDGGPNDQGPVPPGARPPMGNRAADAIGGGVLPNQRDRPGRIGGRVTIDGQEFTYGSGGAGRGSIPYGDYPVNIGKGDIGPVGRRIGSIATIGRPGGVIDDPKYPGRPRAGIQIHAGSGDTLDRLYSQGCFAVSRKQWPAFKRALLAKAQQGPLMLSIGRDGNARIETREEYEARGGGAPTPRARPDVPREKLKNPVNQQTAKVEGSASVNINLNGFPRGTNISTAADGIFSDVELHRGNTMPFASESA